MADSHIGGLGSATTPLSASDKLIVEQSGVAKQVALSNLRNTTGATVTKSSQTITHNDFSASSNISFDTEAVDQDGYWTAGSPTRLTAPADGWYYVSASQEWASNASGNRWLYINASSGESVKETYQPGTGAQAAAVGAIFYLTSGQYVEMRCAQTSGGNIASTGNRFAIVRV